MYIYIKITEKYFLQMIIGKYTRRNRIKPDLTPVDTFKCACI